jgi:hypothetical protein
LGALLSDFFIPDVGAGEVLGLGETFFVPDWGTFFVADGGVGEALGLGGALFVPGGGTVGAEEVGEVLGLGYTSSFLGGMP